MLEFGIRYERRGCGGRICSCLVRGAHESSQFFAVDSLSVCLARLYCSRQSFLLGDLSERRPFILTAEILRAHFHGTHMHKPVDYRTPMQSRKRISTWGISKQTEQAAERKRFIDQTVI
jgi:hypothetical protein